MPGGRLSPWHLRAKAGAGATFALIPEVIAFSFVAGVDPSVGLFASFVLRHGSMAEVIGLNEASAVRVDRLGLQK